MQDIQSTIEKIKQIVIPVIEEEGLELFDIELRRGKGRGVLRIFIEKSTGRVSIRDCEVVSKQISVLLDVEDIIPYSYVLEVSSPGLDRPLRDGNDFCKSVGKLARIMFKEGDKIKVCIGRIEGMEGDVVSVKDKYGRDSLINLVDIVKARLEVEF